MKTIGIAAGALALVGVAAPAWAQTTQQPAPARPDEQPATTTTPMTPQPNRPTMTPAEAARDVGGFMTAPVNAPRGAFELGADAGYTQGFGTMSTGRRVPDLAGPGGTLGVTLGYRINPRWSLAASGQVQGYGSAQALAKGTMVRGATAGVQGTYHGAPFDRLDPFITLGTGYRFITEKPAGELPTTVTHGFELAKVQVGLDFRAGESVAIAPVIGADLNMFMWQSGGGVETAKLTARGINTFVYAGVQGRFDVGGTREPRPAETQVGQR